jgi:hypothetical protein
LWRENQEPSPHRGKRRFFSSPSVNYEEHYWSIASLEFPKIDAVIIGGKKADKQIKAGGGTKQSKSERVIVHIATILEQRSKVTVASARAKLSDMIFGVNMNESSYTVPLPFSPRFFYLQHLLHKRITLRFVSMHGALNRGKLEAARRRKGWGANADWDVA